MANIFHIDRPTNKITLGTDATTIVVTPLTASKTLALNASKELESVQDIRTTASPTFAGLHINSAEVDSTTLLTLESDISNNNEYNEILFKVVGGQNYGAIRSCVGVTGGDSYMSFFTTTNGGTLVRQVTIQHNGKVGFGTYNPETLLTMVSAAPYLTLYNITEEDTDGGRESRLNFKGEQSGGEGTTLARIEVGHSGSADDQKGYFDIFVNDGDDDDSPTKRIRVDSTGFDLIGKTTAGAWGSPTDVTNTRKYGFELHYSGNNYDVFGIRSRANLITTDASTRTATGAELQAANSDGIDVNVLCGAKCSSSGKSTSASATISYMRAVDLITEWGAKDTVTNLYNTHIKCITRNAAGEGSFGTGYGIYLENIAVGGTGQALDAGIYFKDTDVVGDAFTYGIDFSGGTYGTTEIKLKDGGTIGSTGASLNVDSSGFVGIGTDSPDGNFHVHSASAGTVTASNLANDLIIETSGAVGISLLSPNNQGGRIFFGDPDNNAIGGIAYDHNTDILYMAAGGTTGFGLDNSGSINITGIYKIDGIQVVSNRIIDERCDDAINSGDATTDGVIDALRDAMITHGLIAAS